MFHTIRELYNYRDLLYMITWREIRLKYKQSVMGMLWAVLMPMVIVCAGLIVRFHHRPCLGDPADAQKTLAQREHPSQEAVDHASS